MDSEKEKLIQNEESHVQDSVTLRSSLWKYVILAVSMFLYLLGMQTLSPTQTEWVQHKIQNEYFPNMSSKKLSTSACGYTNASDPVYKNYTTVQQDTAHWTMYFNIAQHVPMLLTNMILNTYSDTYGRRFVLLLSVTGSCVKMCVSMIVIYTNESLWYITAAYALDGAMGSFYGTLAGCFAYVADITKDDRNRVLGIVGLEAVMMLSTIISGTLSGYLIETLNLGFSTTAIIAVSTALLGFILLIFLVPESMDKSKRTPAKPMLETLQAMFQFYTSSKFKGKRLGYILLLLTFYMTIASSVCRSTLEQLYLLGEPFCWGPSQIGTFLTARHAAQGIIGMIMLKLLQCCMSNEAIAIIGPISLTASYVVEGLATTDIMIYMVPVAGVLSFIVIPLIRGIMSVITDPDKQGALFSSIAAIEVFASITSVVIANEIYAVTYAFMHGFVFLLLAGLSFVSCILLTAYYVLQKVKLYHEHATQNYKKVEM